MALKKDYQKSVNYLVAQPIEILQSLDATLKEVITKSFSVKNAYISIERLEGNKDNLLVAVNVYKDENKKQIIDTKYYNFIPDTSTDSTPNFYVQAYEYLKTLDEYSGAIDC